MEFADQDLKVLLIKLKYIQNSLKKATLEGCLHFSFVYTYNFKLSEQDFTKTPNGIC